MKIQINRLALHLTLMFQCVAAKVAANFTTNTIRSADAVSLMIGVIVRYL